MKNQVIDLLRRPNCESDLKNENQYLVCVGCDLQYPVIENIILLLSKDELASFYSEGGALISTCPTKIDVHCPLVAIGSNLSWQQQIRVKLSNNAI